MNSKVKEPGEETPTSRWQRGSAALAKRIFKAELPEHYIRSLPAQSLYCVLKHNGLESSGDLLEIATLEQCRLMMDFDFWSNDTVQEDIIWNWLAVTDTTEGLELLQKLFKCFDLKLVALLVSRYVETYTHDEPTEEPPGDNFRSPDKGHTWISVDTGSADNDFLLNRLLALIFETDADLFYQILNIPSVATATQLEEESYQDKVNRLMAEGIPDSELAHEIRKPLSVKDALKLIEEEEPSSFPKNILVVEPLIYDSSSAEPLQRLLDSVKDREELEGALTYLLNCSIVSWGIDFHESHQATALVEKVKGAIAIGIELVEQHSETNIQSAYLAIGLSGLFRLGFTNLMDLQRRALKISTENLKVISDNNRPLFALIAGLREPFPALCETDRAAEEDKPQAIVKAFSRLGEIEVVKTKLGSI